MKRFAPLAIKILAVAAVVILLCVALRLLLHARVLATMGPIPY